MRNMEENKVQNYKDCLILLVDYGGPSSPTYCWSDCDCCLARQLFGGAKKRCDYYSHSPKRIRDTERILRLLMEILGFATRWWARAACRWDCRIRRDAYWICRTKEPSPVNPTPIPADLRPWATKQRARFVSWDLCWWRSSGSEGHQGGWLQDISRSRFYLKWFLSGEMPVLYNLLHEHGVTISKQRVEMTMAKLMGYELADLLSQN